jgi:hypothetical protein
MRLLSSTTLIGRQLELTIGVREIRQGSEADQRGIDGQHELMLPRAPRLSTCPAAVPVRPICSDIVLSAAAASVLVRRRR